MVTFTGQGADCCMVYPEQYPLEAVPDWAKHDGQWPEWEKYMHYVGPAWWYPWWGIYPPYYDSCPYYNGRQYTWTTSTSSTTKEIL